MRVLIFVVLLGHLLCSVDGFVRQPRCKGSLRFAPRVSLSEQIVNMAEDKVDSDNDGVRGEIRGQRQGKPGTSAQRFAARFLLYLLFHSP